MITRRRWMADARRLGSVLILVMTILGVLFVTGLAFMATMNFDAEMIMAEKQLGKTKPGIEAIIEDVGSLAVNSMIPSPGQEVAGELVGTSAVSFAEMPGVHNLFAPIEPYWRDDSRSQNRFRWVTDMAALSKNPFEGATRRAPSLELDTAWTNGVKPYPELHPEFVPVDADGDGIVDSVQVELVDQAPPNASEPFVVTKSAQLESLRKVVNPSSKPTGKVFLGLRIIAHGGMVDLNHSHRSLIRTALSKPTGDLPQENAEFKPYDPTVEEPLLRRRVLLPPRLLPPSRIQGNPLADALTGDGDFADRLFPRDETPREHRYQPFAPDEFDDRGLDLLWTLRMDPTLVDPDDPGNSQYDWRHTVTTISHDDLLRRETWVEQEVPALDGGMEIKRTDVLELMTDANKQYLDMSYSGWKDQAPMSDLCRGRQWADDVLPFEYAAYPHDDEEHRDKYNRAIEVDETGQDIEGVSEGMLADWCKCQGDRTCTLNAVKGKLRLSLPWLEDALINDVITTEQQIRLIQDAFTLMLLNARTSEWGQWQNVDLNDDGDQTNDAYDANGDGVTDPGEGVPRVWTYAADALDEISRTAASLTANLIDFADLDDIPTRVELRSADFTDLAVFGLPVGNYVYGLERQPFITEVAAIVQDGADTDADGFPDDPSLYAEGVELFNPYEVTIQLGVEYELRIDGQTIDIPDTVEIEPHGFVVLYSGEDTALVGTLPPDALLLPTTPLQFNQDSKINLVRTDLQDPVVVDEFDLDGSQVGESGAGLLSAQRLVPLVGSDWTVPIPVDFGDSDAQAALPTFGAYNSRSDTSTPPVEVLFANTGSLQTAFPTTGSLLLLMRYANSESEAFTTYLDDDVTTKTYVPGNPPGTEIELRTVSSRFQIDNGRMPVFDVGHLHHLDPAIKDPDAPWPSDPDQRLTLGEPGGVRNLPWGQLVFDYFTALPLSSEGPFEGGDPEIPRVDDGGLRVHGRININAAPWPVLAGVPFVSLADIPEAFRHEFDAILNLPGNPDDLNDPNEPPTPGMIGKDLAKAIVAYRDGRNIEAGDAQPPVTGNYGGNDEPQPGGGTSPGWRGWDIEAPPVRRGTGFLSVGELANVRRDFADASVRFDAGEVVDSQAGSYLKAIAALAALGDWVTVRSQVFTIYGVVRGENDETLDVKGLKSGPLAELRAADVSSRAIRFQETVDRLPALVGEAVPRRIGKRTVAKYTDYRGD